MLWEGDRSESCNSSERLQRAAVSQNAGADQHGEVPGRVAQHVVLLISSYIMLCYIILDYIILYYIILCYTILYYIRINYIVLH